MSQRPTATTETDATETESTNARLFDDRNVRLIVRVDLTYTFTDNEVDTLMRALTGNNPRERSTREALQHESLRRRLLNGIERRNEMTTRLHDLQFPVEGWE